MKKIIVSIPLVLVLLSNSNSQILSSYGFKVGVTSSNQLFDYSNNFILKDEVYDYRYGMNLGVFAEMFKSQYFSFVFGLSYTPKGMVDNIVVAYVDTTAKGYSSYKTELDRRLDYLTIGTNIKTRYEFENATPYLLTGFRYDVLLKKKIEKLFKETGLIKLAPEAFWDKYKSNILGIDIGVGVVFNNLLSFPIILEWVYNYDLTKIRMHEDLKIQNKSYELKIGIKL